MHAYFLFIYFLFFIYHHHHIIIIIIILFFTILSSAVDILNWFVGQQTERNSSFSKHHENTTGNGGNLKTKFLKVPAHYPIKFQKYLNIIIIIIIILFLSFIYVFIYLFIYLFITVS